LFVGGPRLVIDVGVGGVPMSSINEGFDHG
jgi:hypothetical protein